MSARSSLKRALAALPDVGGAGGITVLTYHRVGGGTRDELDLPVAAFADQVRVLARHDIVSIDAALDRLAAGDRTPGVVLTFDDGFADVYANAWPRLRDSGLPFTLYLASGYLGGVMQWEGATGRSAGAPALSWHQVAQMTASGLCTLGNHTHHHVGPDRLDAEELDACTRAVEAETGVRPRHFAYPWGIRVPAVEPLLAHRFRSAVTGRVGRNRPGSHPLALRRLPVRRSDPLEFFRRKLGDGIAPELAYDRVVRTAKAVGLRG